MTADTGDLAIAQNLEPDWTTAEPLDDVSGDLLDQPETGDGDSLEIDLEHTEGATELDDTEDSDLEG